MKPRLFIASSVEGMTIAHHIQENLDHEVEVTVWNQGVFKLSSVAINDLIQQTKNNDFGVFVFTPDDEMKMRGQEQVSVRDNVLFEMGLFVGALGIERTFIVKPRGVDIHIPTDLIGINPGEYDDKRRDGNLSAALGVFCSQVKERIHQLGPQKAFEDIKKVLNKINPQINTHVKSGYMKISVNINNLNIIKLDEISQNKYFNYFVSYAPNNCLLSGGSNSNGGVNDLMDGMLYGYNFTFKDEYIIKL